MTCFSKILFIMLTTASLHADFKNSHTNTSYCQEPTGDKNTPYFMKDLRPTLDYPDNHITWYFYVDLTNPVKTKQVCDFIQYALPQQSFTIDEGYIGREWQPIVFKIACSGNVRALETFLKKYPQEVFRSIPRINYALTEYSDCSVLDFIDGFLNNEIPNKAQILQILEKAGVQRTYRR